MTTTRRPLLIVRALTLIMISSIMVNGVVPQRAAGSKYSLMLSIGEAGKVAVASLFVCVHDPLTEIARMLADTLLANDRDTSQKVASSTEKSSVPVPGDIAFSGSTGLLPSSGDSVFVRAGLIVFALPLSLLSAVYCRGAPPSEQWFNYDGRSVQLFCILLLFMTCRWASSSGSVRHLNRYILNPVWLPCRVFLFINTQSPSTAAVERKGRLS